MYHQKEAIDNERGKKKEDNFNVFFFWYLHSSLKRTDRESTILDLEVSNFLGFSKLILSRKSRSSLELFLIKIAPSQSTEDIILYSVCTVRLKQLENAKKD